MPVKQASSFSTGKNVPSLILSLLLYLLSLIKERVRAERCFVKLENSLPFSFTSLYSNMTITEHDSISGLESPQPPIRY